MKLELEKIVVNLKPYPSSDEAENLYYQASDTCFNVKILKDMLKENCVNELDTNQVWEFREVVVYYT